MSERLRVGLEVQCAERDEAMQGHFVLVSAIL